MLLVHRRCAPTCLVALSNRTRVKSKFVKKISNEHHYIVRASARLGNVSVVCAHPIDTTTHDRIQTLRAPDIHPDDPICASTGEDRRLVAKLDGQNTLTVLASVMRPILSRRPGRHVPNLARTVVPARHQCRGRVGVHVDRVDGVGVGHDGRGQTGCQTVHGQLHNVDLSCAPAGLTGLAVVEPELSIVVCRYHHV